MLLIICVIGIATYNASVFFLFYVFSINRWINYTELNILKCKYFYKRVYLSKRLVYLF